MTNGIEAEIIKLSVVLSVYNTAPNFLREAVESILAQTYRNYEFIVVDDGSTDGTTDILERYALSDPRVCFVKNDTNVGLTASLRRGFKMARGQYIARMDADDVSHPRRFAEQVDYLDSNVDCVIVGTAWRNVDDEGRVLRDALPPVTNTEIQAYLLRGNPFCHSAVMIRADTLRLGGLEYRTEVKHAQDYDLWSRLLLHGKGYNIPKNLQCVRKLRHGVSISRRDEQLQTMCRIAFGAIRSRLPHCKISTAMASAIVGQFVNEPTLLAEAGETSASALSRFDKLLRLFLNQYGAASESPLCLGRTYLTMAMSEYNMGHHTGARHWLCKSVRAAPSLFLRRWPMTGWEDLIHGAKILVGSHTMLRLRRMARTLWGARRYER